MTTPRTVLLVPFRPDGGPRDRLWAWVRGRWAQEHPDISVYDRPGPTVGPFNRSAAINQAAETASHLAVAGDDWDVALIGDSDSFVEGLQVQQAIQVASVTDRLVVAHDHWRRLSEKGTDMILDGFSGSWEPFVEFDLSLTVSSMIACPRKLWDEVRGFDPGFDGWGFEDIAFHRACHELRGAAHRIQGPVWHLWHPKGDATKDEGYQARIERMHRYTDITGRDEMLALIEELRS